MTIDKVKIIAEIGWNHMGDMALAEKMIKSAAENGADYAKFQTWSVKRLKEGEWDNDGRRQIYENAELNVDKHKLLISLCGECGIKFLSSVFSIGDAELLTSLNVKEVKIPSFESRNHDLIKYCNEHFENLSRCLIPGGVSCSCWVVTALENSRHLGQVVSCG